MNSVSFHASQLREAVGNKFGASSEASARMELKARGAKVARRREFFRFVGDAKKMPLCTLEIVV